MQVARAATFAHKWLSLLLAVQIVFWVASGLFFTLFPIERVRSEHLVRTETARPIAMDALGAVATIRDASGAAPVRLTLEQRPVGPVAIAEFASGPPAVFDARTLLRLSPFDAEAARAIASAHVTLDAAPQRVDRVTAHSTEYHGALPAWRVRFPDGLAVYVAENTGAVTARRSDLWRVYDTLWALHIMDWANHEDFNHPLIIAAAALTLVSVIAGVMLLPFRIRLRSRAAVRPGSSA